MYKDAVFLSPHKFVGGVQTPGNSDNSVAFPVLHSGLYIYLITDNQPNTLYIEVLFLLSFAYDYCFEMQQVQSFTVNSVIYTRTFTYS